MKSPNKRTTRPGRTGPATRWPDAGVAQALDQVAKRFASFRRTNPRLTKIPDRLRAEAVDAWRAGVSQADLRRHCGVTAAQLAQWRQRSGRQPTPTDVALPDGRVFPVVDDQTGLVGQVPPGDEQRPLEIRLGGWSISVRPVNTQPAGD